MNGESCSTQGMRKYLMDSVIAADASLPGGARILFTVMSNLGGEKGVCWPSHATLARMAGCSVSSVKMYLTLLVARRLIRINHSERKEIRSCMFYINRPSQSELPGSQSLATQQNSDQSESGYNLNLNGFKNLINSPLPPKPVRPTGKALDKRPGQGGGYFLENKKFEEFWQSYPKKEAKESARRLWLKMAKNKVLPELADLQAALSRFSDSYSWQRENGRYVPQLVNWLHGQRWLDEAATSSPEPPVQPHIRSEEEAPMSLEEIRAAYYKRKTVQSDVAPEQHQASHEGLLPFSVPQIFNIPPRQKEGSYGLGTRKSTGSVFRL